MSIWRDAEVTRLTGGPFTGRAVADRLRRELANQARYGCQYWPMFERASGRLVGACGLRPRDPPVGEFELGFQLCRAAWGQGYAIEAARSVIAWATAKGLVELIAGHHPENLASKIILERLGFAYSHDELYEPTGLLEPSYRLAL